MTIITTVPGTVAPGTVGIALTVMAGAVPMAGGVVRAGGAVWLERRTVWLGRPPGHPYLHRTEGPEFRRQR